MRGRKKNEKMRTKEVGGVRPWKKGPRMKESPTSSSNFEGKKLGENERTGGNWTTKGEGKKVITLSPTQGKRKGKEKVGKKSEALKYYKAAGKRGESVGDQNVSVGDICVKEAQGKGFRQNNENEGREVHGYPPLQSILF